MSNLDQRQPLVIDTHDLSRRPGSQREISLSAPAPAELGIEMLAVPEGSLLELELRLEAVMDGVLVTADITGPLVGECVRCLDPISDELDIHFQELYLYDDTRDAASVDPDEDLSMTEGDLIDLEPVLRDAIVLDLPLQPLCEPDCAGLCAECGARLADDPEHTHEAPIDPRWAGLTGLAGDESGSGTAE